MYCVYALFGNNERNIEEFSLKAFKSCVRNGRFVITSTSILDDETLGGTQYPCPRKATRRYYCHYQQYSLDILVAECDNALLYKIYSTHFTFSFVFFNVILINNLCPSHYI